MLLFNEVLFWVQRGMESVTRSCNERCVIFNDTWLGQFHNGSNPWTARYVYGLIFLVANLLAWVVRDFSSAALTEVERLKNCNDGHNCLGAERVLRVSLGCFLFYFIMFLSTAGTSKLLSSRDLCHSGWWSAKIVLWIALTIIPFLIPSSFIQLYGEIAHFGAGVFLLIQLIIIVSFITWLNDCCHSEKNAAGWTINFYHQEGVQFKAATAYIICIVGILMMYIWYTPDPSCLLNISFITWTLVLLQLMTSLSLHPKINAGFLTPGLMGLYVVFICWCW